MKKISLLPFLFLFAITTWSQSNLVMFTGFSGTNGGTPTATTLNSDTCTSLSQTWSETGSAATFTYETSVSWPLVGTVGAGTPYVTLSNGTQCSDSTTTGVQMATGDSTNTEWNFGVTNTAISAGSVVGALMGGISTTLPSSNDTDFDVFDLRGQQDFETNDYENAMIGGNGTNLWISLECSSGQDLSVASAPVTILTGDSYAVEFIWNPATGTVTVSGDTVTLSSGTDFTSALMNGLAKIYIGGQATSNAYTIASVNSGTSLTLSGTGPANGTYTYYAAHYMKVRIGWQNPSYPGTVISTQYCANEGGVDADLINFGNSQGEQGTSGYYINWDTALISVGSPIDSPGPSPVDYYAASASSANVQTALTDAEAGGVVVIPPGTATWTSQVSATVTGAVTIVGYTQCTGEACYPGSGSACLSASGSSSYCLAASNFSDNSGDCTSLGTCLTWNVASGSSPALELNGCGSGSGANVCRVTGLTITQENGTSSTNVGSLQINGTHTYVGGRFDHNHIIQPVFATFFVANGGYGLIDHNYYDGGTTSVNDYAFAGFNGDGEYTNWEDATEFGSNQAWILEDNTFQQNAEANPGGVMDGQVGCKVDIRYNLITGEGGGAGMNHGTDSGGNRSCIALEIYDNVLTYDSTQGYEYHPWQSRGGATLFHDNLLNGTEQWNGIEEDYYRASESDSSVASGWGFACVGCNWTPASVGGTSNVLNPPAAAYETSHTYAAGSTVLGSGDNYVTIAGGTTGSSAPTWSSASTIGETVTDSGGVVWLNIGGGTASPPGSSGTNAGFLSTDNETPCSSGSTCTRYFDANGGGYPGRDQPGIIHGQVSYGNYQWNNTGSEIPSSWWATDASNFVELNRDYFNAEPSGYTPYVYPDPLQGGAPTSPTRPALSRKGMFARVLM